MKHLILTSLILSWNILRLHDWRFFLETNPEIFLLETLK